jgi:hypothetical protein
MRFLQNLKLDKGINVGTIFIISLSFIVIGCAASPKNQIYCDSKIDPNKLATIRVYEPTKEEKKYVPDEESQERKGTVGIWMVDEEYTLHPFVVAFANGLGDVCVFPGKHRLHVRASWRSGGVRSDIWLVAEQGGKYVIKAVAKHRYAKIWIEDEKTGEPVGGLVGSDDEPKQ